jgi:diguanylate cyclase (GGDEF)-like protein
VLVVEPEARMAALIAEALRVEHCDVTAAVDPETALRLIANVAPEVLFLPLEPERTGVKDASWMLRRLRDDYLGVKPLIVATGRTEGHAPGRLAALGVDLVLHEPVSIAQRLAVIRGQRGTAPRAAELIRVTLLQGDLEEASQTVAKRLAACLGSAEALVVCQLGERQWSGAARGLPEGAVSWPPEFSRRCVTAVEVAVPIVFSDDKGSLAVLAAALDTSPGQGHGYLLVVDEGADPTSLLAAVEPMRALAARLDVELTWRVVHERIASDRDRLRESSMLDPMLGVWTRSALEQTLPGEVAAAVRRREPMTMAVLDLKRLRHLNERYGHVVGDSALRHVAGLVRATLRTQDLVARYAGDMLAVVLLGTPLADGGMVIGRLQQIIATHPLLHDGAEIPLEVVGGVAPLTGADDTGDGALARAAAALAAAKRRRETLVLADPEDRDELGSGPPSEGLEPGTTLGGVYQILHEISRGAMGVVYRAEDLGLGRPVALKTLRPDLARDANFVERFRTEASTLASVRHENLVQVHAFGVDGEDVYFVMELVEGEPLEDRVELARHDGKLLSFDEIEQIISQIGDALDAMHRAGVLHRDVKPGNILIDRGRDRAVLVDVGIAKRRGTETDPAGTPGFTAPESFTGGAEAQQADVYGLAATAYTLLCAEVPYRGGKVEDVLRKQISALPPGPSQLRAEVPAAVDAVIFRSLDPDPARRHPSALHFARAFAAALQDAVPERAARPPTVDPMRVVAVPKPRADGSTAVAETGPGEPDTAVRDRPISVVAVPSIVGAPRSVSREPEAPKGVPSTRGVLFRSTYRVLGAYQGAAWAAHVGRRYPALGQALQPQATLLSWHPSELFITMLKAIGESGRDARAFARELGRVAAAATFGRFFGANPAHLTPWEVLGTADILWHRYHTWGDIKVNRTGENAAEIRVRGGLRDPLVCECTSGIFEQVAISAGAGQGVVTHGQCAAIAGAECVFGVTWQPAVDSVRSSPP